MTGPLLARLLLISVASIAVRRLSPGPRFPSILDPGWPANKIDVGAALPGEDKT